MSDCCSTTHDETCEVSPTAGRSVTSCPECGGKGKAVDRLTPEHLLTDEAKKRLRAGDDFHFCATADCPVVYFSSDGGSVFHKPDVRVRVTQKETADPVPVCYCYGYFRADLVKEIEETGGTTIPDRIKAGVKAGTCACETKNPQGACCLGNVGAAERWVKAERANVLVGTARKEERS